VQRAGLKIEEQQLEQFRAEFCQYASLRLTDEQRVAELRIDAEVPLGGFTAQTVEQMEKLAPFGRGNARPLLCTTEVTLAEPPRTMGGGARHLSMRLSQHGVTLRAVAFGGADWAEPLAHLRGPIDVAFRPVINAFRGQRNVELQVVDWRESGVNL